MGQFFKQLYMLLWKNFRLRRRQMFRNCVEVIWPLAIFIILVSVRRRRPPEHVPGPMYFPPRALPSTGALPFMASLFCDYRVDTPSNVSQELPKFTSSIGFRLLDDLRPILQNETNRQNLQGLSGNLTQLFRDLSRVVNDLNVTGIVRNGTLNPDVSVSSLLGNETNRFLDFLVNNTRVPRDIATSLVNSRLNTSGLFAAYGKYGNLSTLELLPKLREEILCNGTGLKMILELPKGASAENVSKTLCEEPITDYISIITELSQYPVFGQYLQDLERFLSDLQGVGSEVQSLQSIGVFQNLLRDLQNVQLPLQLSSNRPMVDNWDIQYLFCGRNIPFLNVNNRSTTRPTTQPQPPTTPATTATPKLTPTSQKAPIAQALKFKPEPGKAINDTCANVNPANRVDCGWGGMTETQCSKINCCFDSSISWASYCFCPKDDICCNQKRGLIELLNGFGTKGNNRFFVNFFTMILQSKILYTPHNAKTKLIIDKLNGFVKSFKEGLVSGLQLTNSIISVIDTLEQNQVGLQELDDVLKELRSPSNPTTREIRKQIYLRFPMYEREIQMFENLTEQYPELMNVTYLRQQLDPIKTSLKTLQSLIKNVIMYFDCYDLENKFWPAASEQEIIDKATRANRTSEFLSSIVFLNLHDDNSSFPKHPKYKIRYNPEYVPTTARIKTRYWKPGPGPRGSMSLWHYSYLNFGFVFLQDLVDRAFIEVMTNKDIPEPGVYVQQVPYPCYIKDQFISGLGNSMPLFMTLAWVYTIAMIIKSIVYEKEMRLKEVMKVMGLSNAVHWAAWFITSFVTIFITILILTVLLKTGGILIYSDMTVVAFVLAVFALATIALAFLISVFFSKANISAACGGIIYFFTYLPYPLTLWFEEQMNFSEKGLTSLFSTTAFGMCFKYIARWEEQGIGAQWSNLYSNPMPSDTFSLGWAINFMIIDMILYLLLMWYFENVLPGEYGIPKPWYFPFTKWYWCGDNSSRSRRVYSEEGRRGSEQVYTQMTDQISINTDNGYTDNVFEEMRHMTPKQGKFEKEPTDLKIGVNIKNLVKIYQRGKKRAVDELSLRMYEGQVTALLGHNGAGKSTTMSILTGLFPPTSGTAIVNGHNIRTNIEAVRKSLGLCPQHNVLFDDLTVGEHMWFYGRLKGLEDGKELEAEIQRFLEDVGLPEKRHALSRNLSGGMKRKLSVAMAFIASSKTVILDEPTSGVDPYSRRGIWDLILKHKKDRSILLSTHYMDEADLLGDRINIISKGRLQCSGTPLFLKRNYGKGYFLSVTKDNDFSGNFNAETLSKFVASFVPGAKIHENFGTELTFLLPSAARLTGEFTNLFQNLEKSLQSLGIKSYGISDTTLEEVFLRACGEEEQDIFNNADSVSMTGPAQGRRHHSSTGNENLTEPGDNRSVVSVNSQIQLIDNNSSPNVNETSPETYESVEDFSNKSLYWGPLLWFQQYKAILVKRFHHARRSRKGFFSQILLPAIFVVVAMFVSLIQPPREGLPSLKLTTEMFSKPNYIAVNNINVNPFSEKLFKMFVKNPSPDTCSKSCPAFNPFVHRNVTRWTPGSGFRCSCGTGKYRCPKGASGPTPVGKESRTGDTIIDVTGRNMGDYLLKTTDDFVRLRYGGASFGEQIINFPDEVARNLTPTGFASGLGVLRNVKVWFNHKGYHALPVFINSVNNAILRANVDPAKNPDEYGITAYSHPVDFNQDQVEDTLIRQGVVNLFVAIFVILALAFVPASFVVYLVQDRVSKSKHLQLVSGLNPIMYWFANFTWDLINYLIPAFCCIVIFLAFNQKAFISSDNFPATFALLFLYGWAMTPLMYPFSFFFDVPSTAYIVLIAINLFIGIVGTIATFILDFFGQGDEELKSINVFLKKFFLIFPNYCLGRGLMDLAGNQIQSDVYDRFGATSHFKSPFDWEIVGRNVLSMVFCGFLYMIITLLVQYRFFVKPWTSKVNTTEKLGQEEDVANEPDRITSEEANGEKFVLKTENLTKLYKKMFAKRKVLAVDRLFFGVKKGECFGLLGVNGAGKTSTFKMLTGDTSITSGDAFVNGHSVRKKMNDVRKYMGYCPQFDALDGLLTGKELLVYYSQIRGMSRADGIKMADWAIKTLGLTPHKDKLCGDYSGGNKRKLSTALALVGGPPLIFLDEPTTGMDPGARRFLWNVVTSLIKQGRSVVLTSHSMEECETLCTRLAIMVNGNFQCLGSPQHLRSKFGTGYTIIIRAKTNLIESVKDFINANFVEAKLKDQHQYMLEYQVPTDNLLLSQVFHKLELLRKTNSIEDYSVTQTTLDQIFVNFARSQVESVTVTDEPMDDGADTTGPNNVIRMNSWQNNAVEV